MFGPTRLPPAGPSEAYTTYELSAPLQTHYRAGTCEEAGCLAFHKGWTSHIDESTALGQAQAAYIRRSSGRRFTEQRASDGTTEFVFEPGQRCFRSDEHRVPLEREPLYVVRHGDYRRSRIERQHRSADDWVDDFANHQNKLADLIG
jgi:hypothetical protein